MHRDAQKMVRSHSLSNQAPGQSLATVEKLTPRHPSRRQSFKTNSLPAATVFVAGPRCAAALKSHLPGGTPSPALRLDECWEFRRGSSLGIWDIWRAEEKDLWKSVTLPHSVAANYRGQFWYRSRLALRNPIANGRTVLHFQGIGHATTLWVGPTLIGTHPGGSEDFVFDITDALARLAPAESRQGVPVAILCNRTPDLDRISSGLSGRVTLACLPSVSLDTVHILPVITPGGAARISVQAGLYNPTDRSSSCTASIEILDPTGHIIHSSSQTADIWTGLKELTTSVSTPPQLASPSPYGCRIVLSTPTGQTQLDEPFTIRRTQPI